MYNIKSLSPGDKLTIKNMFLVSFVKTYRTNDITVAVFKIAGGKKNISWIVDSQGNINLDLPPVPVKLKATPEYRGSEGVATYDENKLLHRSHKRRYIGGGQTPSYGELCVGEVARGAITWNRNYWRR